MSPRTISLSMSGSGAGGAGGTGGAYAGRAGGGTGATGATGATMGATWTRTFGTVTTKELRSDTRGFALASLVPAASSSTAPLSVCMWIDAPPLPMEPVYSRCGLGTRM